MVCKNCHTEFEGKYCSACGQKSKTGRITFQHILREIPESILQVETGFPYTVKGLMIRPAGFLKDYFAGKRVKCYKPLGYVILLSTISSLLSLLVTFILKTQHLITFRSIPESERNWMFWSTVFFAEYNSVFYFLMIPLLSLLSFIFFHNIYNYWEHFIANTYLTAQFNFLIIGAQVWRLFNHGNVSFTPLLILFFTYISIVYVRLFNSKKSVAIYVVKMILLIILIVFMYATGLSLAGIMTPWWGTQ
jgi:hypothetical protein